MNETFVGLESWTELALEHQTYTVVDVETTGVGEDDAVVEFALVKFVRGRLRERFSALIDPGIEIPAAASAVHLLRDAHVAGRPTLADYADDIVEFAGESMLVAHNAEFDRSYLPMLSGRPWICTLRLARHLLPDAAAYKNSVLRYLLKLDDAYDLSTLIPHRAEADAIVTGYLLQHLLRLMREQAWTLERVAEISWSLIPVTRLNYGSKFRGALISTVEEGYLSWMMGEMLKPKHQRRINVDRDTLEAVAAELGRRVFARTTFLKAS